MSVFDELNKRFEIEQKTNLPAPISLDPHVQEDDYEHARDTLRDLIDNGKDAIEGASNLAKNSDAPRAYEVLAQLIKTVSDVSKDLVQVQKAKEESNKPKVQNQTNNVFVGSTHELMKMLKDAQKNPPEEVKE